MTTPLGIKPVGIKPVSVITEAYKMGGTHLAYKLGCNYQLTMPLASIQNEVILSLINQLELRDKYILNALKELGIEPPAREELESMDFNAMLDSGNVPAFVTIEDNELPVELYESIGGKVRQNFSNGKV